MLSIVKLLNLRALFSEYGKRDYRKGQLLIHEEDSLRDLYYLESGRVKQYRITEQGTEVVVDVLRKHAIFPMNNVLNTNEGKYFYEAIEPITVRVAPIVAIQSFIKKRPEIALELLSSSQHSMEMLRSRMYHILGSSAYTRVLFEIIQECRMRRREIMQTNSKIELPLHEYELALQAGLSRETTSREMRKLKKRGLVRVGRKFIVVMNFNKIRKEFDGTV